MSAQDWDGLALSIDLLNAAIAQDVQVGNARVVILNRDSARHVRDAAESWVRDYGLPRSPSVSLASVREQAFTEVVDWLEEQDWETVSAQFVADCLRERFELPPPPPPESPMSRWAHTGLKAGDICSRDGHLLNKDGSPVGNGSFWLTKDQARRAAVFGWMLDEGLLPSAHAPDLVAVKR